MNATRRPFQPGQLVRIVPDFLNCPAESAMQFSVVEDRGHSVVIAPHPPFGMAIEPLETVRPETIAPARMTLEQFRATGTDCADLSEATDDESQVGRPGRVYCDVLTIERPDDSWDPATRAKCEAAGGWYLVIGNAERFGTLAELESDLYAFAIDEGFGA